MADLGAGPGFFTAPLAARGLPSHVRTIPAEESRFAIPDGVVDVALLAFVLHELAQPVEFLHEVARILWPGGRLVVLEWVPREESMGPPLEERLSHAQAEALLADGGFKVVDSGEANPSHYFLVAERRR